MAQVVSGLLSAPRCDHCAEWFHFDCLGLDPDSLDESETYVCSTCKATSAPTAAGSAPLRIPGAANRRGDDHRMPSNSLPTTAMRGMRQPVYEYYRDDDDFDDDSGDDAASVEETRLHSARHGMHRKRVKHDDDDEDFVPPGMRVPRDEAHDAMRKLTLSPASSHASGRTPAHRRRRATSLSITGHREGTWHQLPVSLILMSLAAALRRSTRPTRPPSSCTVDSDEYDDDDVDANHPSRFNPDGTRRVFHNRTSPLRCCHVLKRVLERERLRRTTIRTLFDSLRMKVPSLAGQDGVSDRQILQEAVQHIETLGEQDAALEMGVLELRIQNMQLRLQHMRLRKPVATDPLGMIRDAALADQLSSQIADAQERLELLRSRPRPPVQTRERSGSDSSGTSRPSVGHVAQESLLRAIKTESDGACIAAGPIHYQTCDLQWWCSTHYSVWPRLLSVTCLLRHQRSSRRAVFYPPFGSVLTTS